MLHLIATHHGRGRPYSFGIVPACGPAMPFNMLWHSWNRLAVRLGELPDVARRCLITTHCGLHDLSPAAARGATERARQLAESVRASLESRIWQPSVAGDLFNQHPSVAGSSGWAT